YPSGIRALRIGMEDPREREAQLRESARSTDGLEVGHLNRIARGAVKNGLVVVRNCTRTLVNGCACAAGQDGASAEGNSVAHFAHAVQVAPDIVELAAEEEP